MILNLVFYWVLEMARLLFMMLKINVKNIRNYP